MVLDEFLRFVGFTLFTLDQCFYARIVNEVKTILAVYVDNIVSLSDTVQSMQEVDDSLSSKFQMKDLGQLQFCFGINAERLYQKS